MLRLVIIVFPFLFFFSPGLAGQQDGSSNKLISGKIVDDSLGLALSYVHLWNESTRMGTISNDSGEFRISARNQEIQKL